MSLSFRGELRFDLADQRSRDGAVLGLRQAVEHVLQVSNTKVPNDEGQLEQSGRGTVDEDDLTGAVSYDTSYAVRQHEDLTLHHPGGRRAKFLESSLAEEREQVAQLVAAQIRRALR